MTKFLKVRFLWVLFLFLSLFQCKTRGRQEENASLADTGAAKTAIDIQVKNFENHILKNSHTVSFSVQEIKEGEINEILLSKEVSGIVNINGAFTPHLAFFDSKGRCAYTASALPLFEACYPFLLNATHEQLLVLNPSEDVGAFRNTLDDKTEVAALGNLCVDKNGIVTSFDNNIEGSSEQSNTNILSFYQAGVSPQLGFGSSVGSSIKSISKSIDSTASLSSSKSLSRSRSLSVSRSASSSTNSSASSLSSSSKMSESEPHYRNVNILSHRNSLSPYSTMLSSAASVSEATKIYKVMNEAAYLQTVKAVNSEGELLQRLGYSDISTQPKLLGEGSFGQVWMYEAKIGGATEEVVVKRLKKIDDEDFKDEIINLNKMKDLPGFVQILGAGKFPNNERVIIMKNAGEELASFLKKEPADSPRMQKVREGIGPFLLRAQKTLSEKDLSYRDWKAENLTVKFNEKGDPEFTVIDLGMVQDLRFEDTHYGGTLRTMSPEVAKCIYSKCEYSADAANSYSIGATILQVLDRESFREARSLLPKGSKKVNDETFNAQFDSQVDAYAAKIRELASNLVNDKKAPPYLLDLLEADPAKRLRPYINSGKTEWLKFEDTFKLPVAGMPLQYRYQRLNPGIDSELPSYVGKVANSGPLD